MTVVREPIVLPRLVFVKLWEWEGYDPHPVVGVNEYWLSEVAEQRLERAVSAELRRLGLGESGRLAPELRGTIKVLALAEAECHAWISDVIAGENGGALVAALGGEGVRLVRDDNVVRIDPVPADELAEYLVMVLPGVPPAAMNPISVEGPAATRSARDADEPFELHLGRAGSGPTPSARLAEVMKEPRTGVHEIYTAVRTGSAREMERDPLTVLDLVDRGRVLITTDTTDGDEQRITCVPGTFDNLVGRLRGALEELVA